MQFLCLVISALIILELNLCLAGQCRLSNNHKIYLCRGFRYMLTASRLTRQQIVEARIHDCKETEIPEGKLPFPNVQNLTISCDIEKINVKAFDGLNQLIELDLGNNTLTSPLSNQIFKPLSELRALNLSHNQFEELKDNMFEGLGKLKQLFLSHNKISGIEQNIFYELDDLEEIHLNNNEIRIVPVTTFSRLNKLLHIDLSYNEIEALSAAYSLTYNLRHVNLSHNAIKEVPKRIFQATRLEVLDLSNNQLTTIHKESLQLETLRMLYLQNNQISMLEISEMSPTKLPLTFLDLSNNRLVFLEASFVLAAIKLNYFKVDKNPWDCNCYEQMLAIRRNLSLTTNYEHHAGRDPVCVTSISEGCTVDRNNLMEYYTIFIAQLGIRK